ncbi:leukocyte-associated immunoglobulin-like receptor 2 isoform 2-T2 [Glossophaga mutica]
MGPRPSLLLVLGVLPKPSIWAEPGPVIPRGRPATIVCRGPAGAEIFRLEKVGLSGHRDQRNVSQRGLPWAEATFHTDAANELTAGRYFCFYFKRPRWSERSDILELTVTGPASQNYTVGNYVCLGLAGVVLLILVAILAEAGHSWHRWPHGPQGWTQGRACQRD